MLTKTKNHWIVLIIRFKDNINNRNYFSWVSCQKYSWNLTRVGICLFCIRLWLFVQTVTYTHTHTSTPEWFDALILMLLNSKRKDFGMWWQWNDSEIYNRFKLQQINDTPKIQTFFWRWNIFNTVIYTCHTRACVLM